MRYRLSKEAEADLIRIHQWGVRTHGEAQADAYYYRFFERFEQLAEHPLLYAAVDGIRKTGPAVARWLEGQGHDVHSA